MRSQACQPCAKRKVGCDKTEPCSNCKRRKQDCNYPELSPGERIKQLEAIVRALGGSPDDYYKQHDGASASQHGTEFSAAPSIQPGSKTRSEIQRPTGLDDSRSKDPLILEEDGQQDYLES